jgi:cation transport ATPase-like protein
MNPTDSPGITVAARRAARPVAVPQGGLTSAEAAVRLARDGRNELPAARPVRLCTQLAVALGSRARPGTLANPLLPAAVAAALALQLAGLYLPFLRDLLHSQPLTRTDLAVVFALSTLGYAAVRLDRLLHRGKHSSMTGPGEGGRS